MKHIIASQFINAAIKEDSKVTFSREVAETVGSAAVVVLNHAIGNKYTAAEAKSNRLAATAKGALDGYNKQIRAQKQNKKAQEKRVFGKKTVNVAAESVTITKSHTFDQKVELIVSLCNADKKLLGAVLVKLGKKG